MGFHYVYKIFRKIKIVKYCKIWPNHIYRTEILDTPEALFDICDLAIFYSILLFQSYEIFCKSNGIP